ncbi:L-seryl-tRNA(Sec) selenium transferase [Akkermansiaceae bacterium]|nr:L-seryl-tRNA(Sec) selenium transferase [Akkermansiaceae bacterium]MDB4585073.1 L-seryl-tRNA(Sec) selenium transferase [bacterium]MDA7877660.1 L-seryl-tRNA(Sec) selenium transferase [Akkermansiaceae bacterium]MDA8975898.1 L-seryl-tRNA(Sec) selenium transferase [Akkermansiaceae bacterium]MDB4143599.1 L-seryl-tRNA(Sec) selenium transferase [Akkermansiaceae bacterium]
MPDLSSLPAVEKLAAALSSDVSLPRPLVNLFVRREIQVFREKLLADEAHSREEIEASIKKGLRDFANSRLQPVINATGVLIHTNLGRSPLGPRAAGALQKIATGYSNLEFDLPSGARGKRAGYLETALACLLETQAATAVNNCAAALVLTLRTLVEEGKNEVIVSRSELVEIGGGFRIPEILETSGAKLVEVGATNKTHLYDYENAITPQTALILKVHRSNFYIGGFVGEPEIPEIAELCKKHGFPLVEDLGSGAMMNTDDLAPIDHEPTPQECLRRGIDLVIFSGDKLLGGPQSGIIGGRADLIAEIKKEPFFRAVRCDKLILTTLQESIDQYLEVKADPASSDVPVLTFLGTSTTSLRERAKKIVDSLSSDNVTFSVEDSLARPGGGTMPRAEFPSIAIKLVPQNQSVPKLAKQLRIGSPALVGYTTDDALFLDLRTIFPADDVLISEALTQVL